MDVTKPYEFIGFGAMDVTAPYEFIWFLWGCSFKRPCEAMAEHPSNEADGVWYDGYPGGGYRAQTPALFWGALPQTPQRTNRTYGDVVLMYLARASVSEQRDTSPLRGGSALGGREKGEGRQVAFDVLPTRTKT